MQQVTLFGFPQIGEAQIDPEGSAHQKSVEVYMYNFLNIFVQFLQFGIGSHDAM